MAAAIAGPSGPRMKTGCQNCRTRHLKCDDQQPACIRCEKAGIGCVRGYNIRFKHGANPSVFNGKGSGQAKAEYDFSKTQPWVNTARNLIFLDETRELVSIYDHAAEAETPSSTSGTRRDSGKPRSGMATAVETGSQSSPSSSLDINNPPLQRIQSTGQASLTGLNSPTKRRRLTFSSRDNQTSTSPAQVYQSPTQSWHSAPLQTEWTPSAISDITSDPGFAVLEPALSLGQQSFAALSISQIYLESPIWPLQEQQEAQLLRYLVEHLARNFDLTDPLQHFRNIVPQRAATCPPLLNAIFALSARHLSRVSNLDPVVSNRYHQECLKHLIPVLDDTTAILDENLLVSTIILRHLEEYEIPLTGQPHSDTASHLFGSHAFITAQEQATVSSGLGRAAFWTGLRQEIFVAFVNQRSIIPALEHCNIDRSLDPASDDVWACRMVVLCADVIRFCFGDGDHSNALYSYLCDAVAQWHQCKPGSFTPIYFRDAEPLNGKHFAEMWYVGDDILTGLQHYHLARILLCAYNPSIPRLGPRRAATDETIRQHVRCLCGICVSNPSVATNFTYASMGITIAGDKFMDRREQEALLAVLDTCDQQHGWPTTSVQTNLRVAWGWQDALI